ncbi:MAG: TetR/AcrR family transcriptional regulator [Acidimicrobiales bacterium]
MSVRDLNETLGVSHNYLHRRFGSKLDLWRAVVDHWIGGVDDELHAIADRATPGDDPLEVLHRVIVAFVTINCRQPALFRLVNTEASLPGERLDYLHDRYIGPSARGLAALVARLAPTERSIRWPRRACSSCSRTGRRHQPLMVRWWRS